MFGCVMVARGADFALRFDGTNDYVTFGRAAALGATNFTIETWFMRQGTGVVVSTGGGGITAVPLVTKGTGENEFNVTNMNYFLGLRGTDRVVAVDFESTNASPVGQNFPGFGTSAVNDITFWHHAATTYDGTNLAVYVDGVLDAITPATNAANGPGQIPQWNSVQFAGLATSMTSTGAPSGFYNGILDEPRIWAYARSAQEIKNAMRVEITNAPGLLGRWSLNEGAGTITTNSITGSPNGTNVGGAVYVAGYPFKYAGTGGLLFDGVNDYVIHPTTNALGTTNFTVETWFKRTGTGTFTSTGAGGITNFIPLITKGGMESDGTNVDANYMLGLRVSDGVLMADFEEGFTGAIPGNNHPVTGQVATVTDVWYHAAATYDGTNWNLYLNGNLETTWFAGQPPRWDNVQPFGLGTSFRSNATPQGFFAGVLDEVRIWNYARSAAQITNSIYLRIGSATGLISRWSLDEERGFTASNTANSAIVASLSNGAVWAAGYPFGLIAPTTAITSPANASLFYQFTNLVVQASAADADGTVTNVIFLVNGSTIGADASEPFQASWTSVEAGNYSLRTIAQDNDGNSATSAAVQVTVATEPGTGGLFFDGANDFVTFGPTNALGLSRFTLECWFRRGNGGTAASSGAGGIPDALPLVTKGAAENEFGVTNMNYFLGLDQSSGQLVADFEEGDAGATPGLNHPVTGATVIVSNVWTHGAATYDGTNWALYVNGVLDATMVVGQPPQSQSIQHAGLGSSLNTVGAPQGFFCGAMDEVRIWNYARSAAQITGAMNSAISSESGLVSRWSLDEGAGTTAGNSVNANVGGVLSNGPVWVAGTALTSNTAPQTFPDLATGNEDSSLVFNVITNDVDSNIDSNDVQILDAPDDGTISTNGGGSFTFVPNLDFHGTNTLTYQVCDLLDLCSTGTATLVIVSVNDEPTANSQLVSAFEDVATNFTLTSTDVDGPITNFTILTSPTNGAIDGVEPNLTYTPATNFSGIDSFEFQVTDGSLISGVATVTITIAAVNDAPIANGQAVSADEDTATNITLTASDVDGPATNFTLLSSTTNGSLSGSAPDLTYTPFTNAFGGDTFTFEVDDGGLTSGVATVTITIAAVNDAPVAFDNTFFVSEDNVSTFNVNVSDVDGNADTNSLVVITPPADGNVTTNTGLNISYSPNLNFNGTNKFEYRICDFGGLCDTGEITIVVSPQNDPPSTSPQSVSAFEDTATNITLTATDVDGPVTNFTLVSSPTNGLLSGTAPDLTYTPDLNVAGVDSFAFAVDDGSLTTSVTTVTITVGAVNDAPIANGQAVSAVEDTATNITLTASDVDGPVTNYTVVSIPTNGLLTGTAPDLTYTPNLDVSGVDSFTFEVDDGSLTSSLATVMITVAGVNDAPTATDDLATTNEDAAATLDVAANDTDVDNGIDTNSVVVLSVPANGVVTTNAGGVLTFTPAPDFNGTNTFDYQVCDLGGLCDTGTVTVVITPDAEADLGISKTDSPDPIVGDSQLTYTIVVTNAGPDAAEEVTVTDTLPAGVTPSGIYVTNLGTLAAGSITSITIQVSVDEDTVGVLTNVASVTSTTDDGNLANNSASETTTIQDNDNDGNPDFNDADDDDDGIPDFWEIQYGLDPLNPADATLDSDLDQFLNIQEYIADTVPTNAASFHHAAAISPNPPISVTFPSSTGRVYDLQYSTNLLLPGWGVIETNVPGQPGTTTLIDTNENVLRHYRIGVSLPPPPGDN